jgi:hypothetical protein
MSCTFFRHMSVKIFRRGRDQIHLNCVARLRFAVRQNVDAKSMRARIPSKSRVGSDEDMIGDEECKS